MSPAADLALLPQFQAAQNAGQVLSALGLAIGSIIFLVESHTLVATRGGFKWKRSGSRSAVWLWCITASYLAVAGVVSAMWRGDYSDADPFVCDALAVALCILYLVEKGFSYVLLYERLLIVHTSMHMDGFWLKLARLGLLATAVAGIPVLFYWQVFVYFRGHVYFPHILGYCEQYETSVVPIVLFLIADASLSLFLLVLFIMPLWTHAKMLSRDQQSAGHLYILARKNLIISCVMIMSMSGSVIFMAVVTSRFLANNSDFNDPMIDWKVFGSHFDSIVTLIACHFLTTIWMPPRLREFFRPTKGSSTTATAAHIGSMAAGGKVVSHVAMSSSEPAAAESV